MKFITKYSLAVAVTLNLLIPRVIFALEELPATPSVLSEPSAELLITEINFKNKEKDFAVISYISPSQKPANLKDLTFKDDGLIKTIDKDFFVASGQQILLTWNTDQPDVAPYLYTTKKGLTATTEQLILYDQNGTIIDMVCWTSDSPTESEIEDFNEAYEHEGWATNDITSCIPSSNINNNESIHRKEHTDTNSISDWILPEPPTNSETIEKIPNLKVTQLEKPQTVALQEEEKILINPELISINIPKTEIAESSQKSPGSKESSSYKNGSISKNIVISEILPNPEGSDSGKEWIELYNDSETDINLGNWILDDDEDGSKPFTLPDSITVKSGQTKLIDCKTAKLSLGNTEDSVRLFDFNDQIVDETQYESAPSNESYSLISIIDEQGETTSEYQWTETKTPGQPNPFYKSFIITVESDPVFDKHYFFSGKTSDDRSLTIIFTEDTIAAPLAKATFTKGSTIDVVVEETDDNSFNLISYKTVGTQKFNSSPSGIILPLFIGFLIVAGISLYIAAKKIHWQLDKKSL